MKLRLALFALLISLVASAAPPAPATAPAPASWSTAASPAACGRPAVRWSFDLYRALVDHAGDDLRPILDAWVEPAREIFATLAPYRVAPTVRGVKPGRTLSQLSR